MLGFANMIDKETITSNKCNNINKYKSNDNSMISIINAKLILPKGKKKHL